MKYPYFFISLYGWTYWVPILLGGGLMLAVLGLLLSFAPGSIPLIIAIAIVGIFTLAGLAFFRDFPRTIPAEPGLMVAPADGTISEITTLDHYAPFNGPALKIGIFLSVLDVHVNRAPCEGVVLSTRYEEGLFLDARHPQATSHNQSNTVVLGSPDTGNPPVAVVKQIVGAIARRIITPIVPGDKLSRGQRFGMIAFGSRTELYVPNPENWEVAIRMGEHVKAGSHIMLKAKK